MKLLSLVLMCLAIGCGAATNPRNTLFDPAPVSTHVNWLTPQQRINLPDNKHGLIYVHTNDCTYCLLQDKVFEDPEIIAEINADYWAISADLPFPTIKFVPTMIFMPLNISTPAEEAFRIEQYTSKEHLLPILKQFAKQ